MQKHERAVLAMMEKTVKPLGLTATYSGGGKHPAVEIEGRGNRCKISISGSPRAGEAEALNYARQQLNRWLRSINPSQENNS